MVQPASEVVPMRILVVLHGSIGDVTRALPLAAMLRKKFPGAFLAWSVEPACFPLLQGQKALDEIIVFDRARWWKTFGPFLARVRAGRFDLVLDLQRLLRSGVISWWTGAARRVGFHRRDSKEFNWVFNNAHIPPFGDAIPKIEHYMKFADYLGIPRSPLQWQFDLTAEERAAVDRHLSELRGGFAVLFVGTRWESKQWFPAQMSRCAELLKRAYDLDVILLGGKDEQQLAKETQGISGVELMNLAGRTTLREAIGIIERAKIAIGPDTGLMHIAAAVRTPVISLWGATSPLRTGPHGFDHLILQGRAPCVPCYRRQCCIGRICLQSISPEQIEGKIRAVLSQEMAPDATHAG